jgi:hypothetical protein
MQDPIARLKAANADIERRDNSLWNERNELNEQRESRSFIPEGLTDGEPQLVFEGQSLDRREFVAETIVLRTGSSKSPWTALSSTGDSWQAALPTSWRPEHWPPDLRRACAYQGCDHQADSIQRSTWRSLGGSGSTDAMAPRACASSSGDILQPNTDSGHLNRHPARRSSRCARASVPTCAPAAFLAVLDPAYPTPSGESPALSGRARASDGIAIRGGSRRRPTAPRRPPTGCPRER